MPFDYKGAKIAGYSDAEINGFLAQSGAAPKAPMRMPEPPTNIPYENNPAAAQKFQEGYNSQAGKDAAETIPATQSRASALAGLDEAEKNLEYTKQHGGMSGMYDVPGVTPAIHAAYSGFGIGRGMNENATNRDVYKANIGSLAAQLKKIIRGSGEGVWTDKDQEFLMQMLPHGADYNADKRIISGLRDGSLLGLAEKYRTSDDWKKGAPKTEAAKPVNLSTDAPPAPPAGAAIDYREYFK